MFYAQSTRTVVSGRGEREREREREMYYIKRAAMQTNTGERLVRVRSAARMELETEA